MTKTDVFIRFRWSSVDGGKRRENANVDVNTFMRFQEIENGALVVALRAYSLHKCILMHYPVPANASRKLASILPFIFGLVYSDKCPEATLIF